MELYFSQKLTKFTQVKATASVYSMKQLLSLCFGFLFSLTIQAQFVSNNYVILDDMQERIYGEQSGLSKKAKTSSKNCGKDTVTFPYYKASRLVTINVSNGYSLGQFYEAPAELTIDGFEFYAWQTGGNSDTVELYCHIYKAGADSLPTGLPLRSDTLLIDSTFGGGALSNLRQSATFKPLTYDSAYILVLTSKDTTNGVAVVTNDYAANDGDGENLACGSISNLWYHFLDLNIGGRTLNCDVLLHPYVSYKYFNDFTYKDCYTLVDTLRITNTSSPFYSSRMYNRYTFFNLEYFCHSYRFENRYYTREVHGRHKYTRLTNDSVRLISTLYTLTGGRTCVDTAYHDVNFLPIDINFSGSKELCSGEFTVIRTNTNSTVQWFHDPSDTVPFSINERYVTPALFTNDTFYAQAVNGPCRTKLKTFAINVTEKPDQPVVTHDSVCLNSKANLSAKSSVGIMHWYSDSSNSNLVFQGDVLQTSSLSDDTSFYVQAQNKQCNSDGFIKVNALVSKDFAPAEPQVANDTNICLAEGEVAMKAKAVDPIRWYLQPSGGTPFQLGGDYKYAPSERGSDTVYVDAFDGRCASSRVQVKINTQHFPTIPASFNYKVCESDSLLVDLSPIHGVVDWFDGQTNPDPSFTGLKRWFKGSSSTQTQYLLPREGVCLDTVRHPFVLETTKEIHPDFAWVPTACSGDSLNLESKHTGGNTVWMNQNDSVLYRGNPYPTGVLRSQTFYRLYVENDGCVGDTIEAPVEVLPAPNSNYDFQINNFRNVLFQAKVANQGTYLWDFDDKGQTKPGRLVNYDFSDDGDFNVKLIVTSAQGCKDSTVKVIRIENTGSIADKVKSPFIKVFPNPVKSELQIQLKENHDYHTVQVIDQLGRSLMELPVQVGIEQNFWLNTSHLAQGTYIVQFTGDHSQSQELIVKQ